MSRIGQSARMILAMVALFLAGCGLDSTAGRGGGDETGNGIAVVVATDDGRPAIGARASLRPANFLDGEDFSSGLDLVVGEDGRLVLPDGLGGEWKLEVRDSSGGAILDLDLTDRSPAAASLVLRPFGELQGYAGVASGGAMWKVSLRGTTRSVPLQADGTFQIPRVSPGTYRIVVARGADSGPVVELAGVVVESGRSGNVVAWTPSLVRDSLLVRAFLDSCGLKTTSVAMVARPANGRLETLDLDSIGLTSLHRSIGTLDFVVRLHLSGNPLRLLPEELGDMAALTELDASRTGIDSLPDALQRASWLRNWNLSFNAMRKLPAWLGSTRPFVLVLDSCGLDSIPEAVLWDSLVTLNLKNNRIREIPERMGDLSWLRMLILENNLLRQLPASLSRLDSLEFFTTFGNSICTVDPTLDTWMTSRFGPAWNAQQIGCP